MVRIMSGCGFGVALGRRGAIGACVAALWAGAAGGCASSDSAAAEDRRAEGRHDFGTAGPRSVGGTGAVGAGAEAAGWTIVVATFAGEDGLVRAAADLPAMQSGAGLPGLFVEERKRGACIAYGRYESPTQEEARRDLERLRAVEVRGVRPFGRAFLAPPPTASMGAMPELSLAQAKRQYGEEALYTLQVAVYETENRAEAQREAEKAAFILRQEGELAFYHHGPLRSMVTIGVFGEADIDVETMSESPEIVALRGRYPYNLYNGMGLRETAGGRSRLQQSQLVEIP